MTKQRNTSLDYRDHTGLLHQLARKAYGRMQSVGVPMDYDDILQEMSVTFVKATKLYRPDAGYAFTAYLGRAIWNQFNKVAERLIEQHLNLGLTSIEEMEHDAQERGSLEGSGSMMERMLYEEGSYTESPEDIIERGQLMAISTRIRAQSLSADALQVVRLLASPSEELVENHRLSRAHSEQAVALGVAKRHTTPEEITLAFIFRFLKLNKGQIAAIKAELLDVYGVEV